MEAFPPEFSGLLLSKGYQIVGHERSKRNWRIKASKSGCEYFIKLAVDDKVSERLVNEAVWNERMGKALGTERGLFRVPEVVEHGTWGELAYLITPFYAGKPICEPWGTDAAPLDAWLERVINTNLFLLDVEGIRLPRDAQLAGSDQERAEHYFEKTKSWFDTLANGDQESLAPLLEIVRRESLGIPLGLNHCDFVPWHMLEDGDRFILIDGEHATSRAPRFYDIAYFFHRVATKASDQPRAINYLHEVYCRLGPQDRQKFKRVMHALLASRIIGGFFDAHNDQTDLAPHRRFAGAYLADRLMAL